MFNIRTSTRSNSTCIHHGNYSHSNMQVSRPINRDDHQNLKLLSIDLNQMHLIGLVERTILVFKSSKSDVSLQSYGL